MTTMATETVTRRRARPQRRIRADITDAPRRPTPAARTIQRAAPTTPIHRSNYQAVILAEFVAAIVLTAATPIAKKKSTTGGLSPYVAGDMVQIAAITILYFILALVSVGGGSAARFSAWFGGLILLAVGLTEATTIAKTLDVFGTSVAPPNAGTGVAEGSAGPLLPQTNPTVGGIA